LRPVAQRGGALRFCAYVPPVANACARVSGDVPAIGLIMALVLIVANGASLIYLMFFAAGWMGWMWMAAGSLFIVGIGWLYADFHRRDTERTRRRQSRCRSEGGRGSASAAAIATQARPQQRLAPLQKAPRKDAATEVNARWRGLCVAGNGIRRHVEVLP
jgi:hypothetical protein